MMNEHTEIPKYTSKISEPLLGVDFENRCSQKFRKNVLKVL